MKLNILTCGILSAIATPRFFFAADTGAEGGGVGAGTAGTGEYTDPAVAGKSADGAAPGTPEPPKLSPAEFLAAHPIVEVTNVEIKKLVIDAGTQPRVAIDNDVVKEYGDIIKASIKEEQPNPFDSLPDDKLPQVFRDPTGRCVLADGFHRYGGHKLGHAKEMRVAIRAGTERDALLFSLGTNQEHGVRRTNKDKQRAVKIALTDGEWVQWANTDIARVCGVSEFMVRELRSVTKAPATRKVTIRGKTTTMKTGAIGKGKGGGAKGAKAKAKAAGKTPAAAKKDATKATEDAAKEIDGLLMKIVNAVGGTEGGKIRAAYHDGSLQLSPREVRDWASFDPKKIKAVAPLVTGGSRMKPTKAFDFITSEIPTKIIDDLHLRAIGNGGTYTYEGETVKVVVTHLGKK